jgi:4-hydroxy-tetrahydrodipicolinate synthase
LDLILGIATPSLDEAMWSCEQGAKAGAVAALVMAPGYFREASPGGVVKWFQALMESSSLPILGL